MYTKYQRAPFLDRLCMRSQDVHEMLYKPKSTPQKPLTAAAWEIYLRDHARIEKPLDPPT